MLHFDTQAKLHWAATVVSARRLHRAATVVKGLKSIYSRYGNVFYMLKMVLMSGIRFFKRHNASELT